MDKPWHPVHNRYFQLATADRSIVERLKPHSMDIAITIAIEMSMSDPDEKYDSQVIFILDYNNNIIAMAHAGIVFLPKIANEMSIKELLKI